MKQDNIESNKNDEYMKVIQNYIENISYGSVVITIQDSKIVQIEKNEKLRIH